MSKKYTEHKLGDRALIILSQLDKDRPAHYHGVALDALKRKGLAVDLGEGRKAYPKTATITDTGRAALQQARREGW